MTVSIFLCLYALCISSFQKCLLKFSAHFWILLLSCTSPLYLSDIDPLSDIWFENIFFYSVVFSLCWLFLLLPRSFKVDVVSSVYFCFCYLHFSCHILGIIAKSNVKKISPILPLGVLLLQVLCLGFLSILS